MNQPRCCPECGTAPACATERAQLVYGKPRRIWACPNRECDIEWIVYEGTSVVVKRPDPQPEPAEAMDAEQRWAVVTIQVKVPVPMDQEPDYDELEDTARYHISEGHGSVISPIEIEEA